jgi:hypothetical protein
MKRYIYTLLFFLISITVGLGQQYQRMQISASDLGNISIPAYGNPISVKAHCLDEARDLPSAKVSLGNILNNPKNVLVEFTDNNEIKTLNELLVKGKNKGIEITGSDDYTEEELLKEIINDISLGKEPSLTLKVKVKNNTQRPIKFICKGNLQVGEILEPDVQTYGATEQDEIWVNTSLKKLSELGYISNSDFENSLKSQSLTERKEKLNEIVRKFEVDKKIESTGDLHTKNTQSTFNTVYNKYLVEKVRQDKIKKDIFKTFDLGINGNTSDDLIRNYKAATGITEDISWVDLKNKIKKDYDENLYFLYDKFSFSYIKYLKSKKIKGLLIKYSEYAKKNLVALENNLFASKIDQSKVHILNFLSKTEDDETFKTLRVLFPNNHSDFSAEEISNLKQKIKGNGIKYIFCFGHYKKDKIFTTVNGKTIEYNIDLIYKIGKLLNVEMFFIGCESSLATGGGTGTTINVNSIKILNNLFESLNTAESLGGFFTTFTSKGEQKYNFSYEFEENTEIIKVFVFERVETEFGNNYNNIKNQRIVISFPQSFYGGIINQNNNYGLDTMKRYKLTNSIINGKK